jgi:photosystem II stability/assembly factor-like uncharacterized protein
MKTKIFLLAVLFACGTVYGQSGWVLQNSGVTVSMLSISFPNPSTGFAAGWYATLLKTTNGGDNWFMLNSPTPYAFQTIFFTDINTGYAAGQNGTIIKTTNSGLNWFTQSSGTSNMILILHFLNSNTGYGCGYSGTILKTTNGGSNWLPQTSGTTLNLLSINFYDQNVGYVTGNGGKFLKTINGGLNWIDMPTGVSNNLGKMAITGVNTVYTQGTQGIILKTTNGGTSFVSQNSGTSLYLTSTEFKSVNTGYTAGANGFITKTTNGGLNWIAQPTPTTSQLQWIYFLNDTLGWACGENGTILKTTSGGVVTPIPTAPILTSPLNGSVLYTSTPIMDWNDVLNATSYKITISPNSGFSVITDSATVNLSLYQVPPGKLLSNITYYWRVNATNQFGTGPWSTIWMFIIYPNSITQISGKIPEEFSLYQNFPNPFNPSTNIKFDIPKASSVRIDIYDSKGSLTENLFKGNLSAGAYISKWDASKYGSGIYFVKLRSEEFISVKRMVLIK